LSFRGRQHTCLGSLIDDFGGSIQTGPFGTVLQAAEYRSAGVPLISVRELVDGRIVIDERTPRVGNATLERLPTYILKVGDIVFGRKGAVERAAIITDRENGWFLGSDGIRVRLGSAVNARFVHYQVRSPRVSSWLNQHAGGTTMASMNQKILRQLPIVVPSLSEQKAIASILGALDDKIDLNRRMNETLEAMARALYKSWFVDFDPVVAKAAGKRPFGMDDATAALFPDRFVDSELGPIPEGWRISRLHDEISLVPGRSYSSKELYASTVALVTLKSFARGGGFRSGGLKPYTGKYSEEQVVDVGDLVVARTDLTQAADVIGRPAIVESKEGYEKLVASLDLLVVRPNSPELLHFYYEMMRTADYVNHALGYANGTTVLHLQKDALPDYAHASPPEIVSQTYCQTVDPWLSLRKQNDTESQTLAQLRDLLLPKLISGEVRIKDAEKAVGEVV